MRARHSGKPLAEKFGIKPGFVMVVIRPTIDYIVYRLKDRI